MEVKVCKSRITSAEKETLLLYDYIKKTWVMDSTVSTHYNNALSKGWTPIVQHVYEDGTVFGYKLEAPGRAVTIRNVEKKQISEKQMENLTKNT